MPHFFPPYLTPKGEWSTMLPLNRLQWEYQRYCHLCSKGATSGHMMTDVHNRNLNDWKRQGCPPVHIAADRFTDNQRVEMVLQAFLPSFTREQILVTKERVLQEEWYRSSGRYEGPIPDEEEEAEVMVVSLLAGPSSSAGLPLATLTRAGYMDGAATASEVRARRCVDEATVTTSRGAAEEEGTGQDQWKALAGHIRCSSSVVGPVGKCGASSPVDASECLTSEGKQLRFRRPVGSLEGDGGSPQGCIGESRQLRWNQRQRLWRIGEQGRHRLHQSRWWHRLRHHARLRSHLYHHHARLQSRFFRHRVRHQHHCLHRRRPLEFTTLGPQRPIRAAGRPTPPLRGRVILPGNGWVWSGHRNDNSGKRLVCERPLPHAASGHVGHSHNLLRLQR